MLSWNNTSQTITLSSDIPLIGGIDNAVGVMVAPTIEGTLIGPVTFRTIGAPVATPIVARMTGTEAVANGLPYGGGFANFTWGDAVIAPAPAGDWLSFTMAGYSTGTEANHTVQVDLLGENVTGGSIYLNAVPEPATMALLGLGGLLLKRRKA
jgi:hypothetical protein